jgi:hypothetical protein
MPCGKWKSGVQVTEITQFVGQKDRTVLKDAGVAKVLGGRRRTNSVQRLETGNENYWQLLCSLRVQRFRGDFKVQI